MKTKEQLQLLKEEHFKKIELSDAIYVINKNNYIGESKKLEKISNFIETESQKIISH